MGTGEDKFNFDVFLNSSFASTMQVLKSTAEF